MLSEPYISSYTVSSCFYYDKVAVKILYMRSVADFNKQQTVDDP